MYLHLSLFLSNSFLLCDDSLYINEYNSATFEMIDQSTKVQILKPKKIAVGI